MTKPFLKSLGLESDNIAAILEAHGDTVERNKANAVAEKEQLSGKIAKLEGELKAAQEAYSNDQESYKVKYEAEVSAREVAEKTLADEQKSHKASVDGYAAEKETAAKSSVLRKAIADFETDKGKLNPKQVDLALLAVSQDTVKWDGKPDTGYTVKNIADVMAELSKNEGFDFAKAETRTVHAGVAQQTTAQTATDKVNYTAQIFGGGQNND